MKLLPKMNKKSGKPQFMQVNVLASILTTMNLYMGAMSILASIGLEFQWAANYILFAIIFDMLDGFVARLTRTVSDFGKELDSLCDMVSFGVAPAVLVFIAYLPADMHLPVSPKTESIVGMTGSYMALFYIICAALRLARFNTYHAERKDFFIGLPSPAAAGTLATFVLFLQYFEKPLEKHVLGAWAYVALGPASVILAMLMVSSIQYPKNSIKAFIFRPRHAFFTLALCGVCIVIAHYAIAKSPSLVLFPLALIYVGFGLAYTLYGKAKRHTVDYAGLLPDIPDDVGEVEQDELPEGSEAETLNEASSM